MTERVIHETHVKIGRGPGRGGERFALVIFLLVLIAMVKPWGETPVAETLVPRPPGPAPTERVLLGDHVCTGSSWLIQVDKRWVGQVVRAWVYTDAVEAFGPADPGIPFVTVTSSEVLALGYCPSRADSAPLDTQLTIYRLGPTVEVLTAHPVTAPDPAEAPENVMVRPAGTGRSPSPSGATEAPLSWESGRYALQIEGSRGFDRWLGLEIRIVDDGRRA